MTYHDVISTRNLFDHIHEPKWAIIDCRFSLNDVTRGQRDYQEKHIPGAVYADLDNDLSAVVEPGRTGRHPLPAIAEVAHTFGRLGIGDGVQVVAYDDAGGSIAARLWWMLKWFGHQEVAVLDGGWQKWLSEGFPVQSGTESRDHRIFTPRIRPQLLVTSQEMEKSHRDDSFRVIDSRTADRYRGENETLDPVAGHIPGAICLPYPSNLSNDGTFRSKKELKAQFLAALGDIPADKVIFYCGSGVTAAHNLLALAYSGLGEGLLYAGSWSEWISDPQRPIASGSEPG